MRAVLTLDGLSISEPTLRAAKKRLTARALQIQDQAATALEQLAASAAPIYPSSLSAADGVSDRLRTATGGRPLAGDAGASTSRAVEISSHARVPGIRG